MLYRKVILWICFKSRMDFNKPICNLNERDPWLVFVVFIVVEFGYYFESICKIVVLCYTKIITINLILTDQSCDVNRRRDFIKLYKWQHLRMRDDKWFAWSCSWIWNSVSGHSFLLEHFFSMYMWAWYYVCWGDRRKTLFSRTAQKGKTINSC